MTVRLAIRIPNHLDASSGVGIEPESTRKKKRVALPIRSYSPADGAEPEVPSFDLRA